MCLYPIEIPVKKMVYDVSDDVSYGVTERMTVSCGKCAECLAKRSKEWSFRIMDECSLYDKNCFLTLTYDNENLPENGTLRKKDFQDFMKRLRFHLEPSKVRFFACGEYGSKGLRPHYHAIIFGWCPDDLQYLKKDKSGAVIYRSPFLEKIWTFGFSSVGEVTLSSAKYCAKYMQKLNTIPSDLEKPFTLMSNRPGIGFDKISSKLLSDGRLYRNGDSVSLPRYYKKVLQRDGHAFDVAFLNDKQQRVAELYAKSGGLELRRNKINKKLKKLLTKTDF